MVGNAPASTPTNLSYVSCGTWVLQQVGSTTELNNAKAQIDAALNLPGVVGLSLRFPWRTVDTDFSLLNAGAAIAAAHGKQFSVRFMAGRWTPDRVFTAGSPFYRLSTGEQVPTPFYADGSPNTIFESAWSEFVGRLATWSRAHGVHLLHLAWYGQNWAELNDGVEVRAQPGYTSTAWLNAHKRLVRLGAAVAGPDLSVEVPLSGYGPLANGLSAALADEVIATVGANSDRFFVQANGWGPNGDWGAPNATTEAQFDQIWSKPVRRGEQMIQPQDYDWTAVYHWLYVNQANYGEVYLPSFRLANQAQLDTEIAKFGATCSPPVSTTTTTLPPTTTTTVPPTTTTTTFVDTQAPSVPTNLALASKTRTSVTVCWSASRDNVRVAGYYVSVDGAWVATTTGLCDTVDGLTRHTSHTVGVRAFDGAGNVSARASLQVSTHG